jgi:hypothetical protein
MLPQMNPNKMSIAISFYFSPPVQMTVRNVPVEKGRATRRSSRALCGYGVTPVFRQTRQQYHENPV